MIALGFLSDAARLFRRVTPQAWLIVTMLAGVVILLAYCTSQARQDERQHAETQRVEAYVRAQEIAAKAAEKASSERLTDFQINTEREKERQDATASIPDTRPSDRRVARACVQLRQQGTPKRDLPAACL